ncbi:UNVERIFIED_ORG: hypothetical protein M2355_000598 [Lelliottia amnigena]|nr:hypothetical protein [Lelliottia amnigena]
MSDLILTKNIFLKKGMDSLSPAFQSKVRLIIIDLDSFQSLNDIINALRNERITIDLNVCLLGSGCIKFKMLNAFCPIALNKPLSQIKAAFSTRRFHKVSELVSYIYSLERLSMLTNRERQCLLAFQKGGEINVASARMNLAEKTMYTVLRNVGNKINLATLLQIREFLSCNSFVSNER